MTADCETPAAPDARHAVRRLRDARVAASTRPYLGRGGAPGRCDRCRLFAGQCVCALTPEPADTRAGVCLFMGSLESFKPSNTGWLIADAVADTWAFGWSRTEPDPAALALLADPAWAPVVVFPTEFAAPARAVDAWPPAEPGPDPAGRRPLFVLLDGTWSEARKMFNKSPYLDALPVLGLHPDHPSAYRLRRARREGHLCTAEVAALCLAQAGDERAAHTLAAWLDVFTHHYLRGKQCQRPDLDSPAHARLGALRGAADAP